MDKNKHLIAKLDIIQELTNEPSVKQLAEVLKEYIMEKEEKDSIGFKGGNK